MLATKLGTDWMSAPSHLAREYWWYEFAGRFMAAIVGADHMKRYHALVRTSGQKKRFLF